jgi:Flp pilus assembly protein TadG
MIYTANDRTRERGTAAVEFALVLPVLLLLLFMMIEFSIVLYDKAVLTNASREGARKGIVMQPPPRVTAAEIATTVVAYSGSHMISFGPSAVTTSVAGACVDSGDTLTVSVSYPYQYFVLPNLMNGLTGPLVLNAVTVMRCE